MIKTLFAVFFLLFVTGCAKGSPEQSSDNRSFVSVRNAVIAEGTAANSASATEPCGITYPRPDETLAPRGLYEPENGCCVGAYILEDYVVNGDITEFEEKVGAEHAVYIYRMRLGGDFPFDWVLSCIAGMKTPFISVYPPENGRLYDREMLERTAGDCGTYNIPVFINFYPLTDSETFDAAEYAAFYIEARELFTEYAPKAAFVWSVDSCLAYGGLNYYPGDGYTDWAGLCIYADIGGGGDYPALDGELGYFYNTFRNRKPMMISEFAASHYSPETNSYFERQAAEFIVGFYENIAENYPRIKMINYMDIPRDGHSERTGAYCITSGEPLVSAYENALKNIDE